jgi:hypothetical protein
MREYPNMENNSCGACGASYHRIRTGKDDKGEFIYIECANEECLSATVFRPTEPKFDKEWTEGSKGALAGGKNL